MLADVMDHPDRYSAELVGLARDLLEKRRQVSDLTSQEQALLNVGALEFYQYRPEPQMTKTPVSPPRPKKWEPVEPPAVPEVGVDLPAGVDPDPYWFM